MSQRGRFLSVAFFVALLALARVWSAAPSSAARQQPAPNPPPQLVAELRHQGWVSDAALSPDGRLLATCSFIDQTVRVWDVERATEVRRMVAGPVWAVAFSPDGRMLATSIEGAETLLIDVSKWTVLKKLGAGKPNDLCCRASVVFSPDGATLLVGEQGRARLWEVASGRELKSFDAGGKVSSVAFSPDGRLAALAVEDRDTALVFEVATGKEVRRIEDAIFFATAVSFSPDGKKLLTAGHTGARLWSLDTGERLQRFFAPIVQAATFTPDGTHILLAGQGERDIGSLTLWDVQTGERVLAFGDKLQKYGLALSRDGCTAAAGGAGSPRRQGGYSSTAGVWDLCSRRASEPSPAPRPRTRPGQPTMSVQLGNEGVIEAMAFSPAGTLIATTDGAGGLVLWQAATGRQIRRLNVRGSSATGLSFSDDEQKLLTVGEADDAGKKVISLQLWSPATGEMLKDFGDLPSLPKQVAISKNGRQVWVENKDGRIRLLDAASGETVKSFEPGSSEAASAKNDWRLTGTLVQNDHEVVSPDGRYKAKVLLTDQPIVMLEETATNKGKAPDISNTHVHTVLFSPDGKYLLGDGEGAVLWDVETGKQVRRFEGLVGPAYLASFSKDGRTIMTTSRLREQVTATVWDADRGAERRRVQQTADGYRVNMGSGFTAALSPDGQRILMGSASGDVRMWDAGTGREVRRLSRPLGKMFNLTSLSFSPDGRSFLAARLDGTSLFDSVGARPPLKLKEQKLINYATFSADGRLIATTGNDRYTVVWDARTGRPARVYGKHDAWVGGAAFSPDNRYLVTAEIEGAVRLWDNATGELVLLLQDTTAPATSVAFSPDGNYVLAGGGDGVTRLWDRRTGAVAQRYETGSWVFSVAFSASGEFVLTAGQDGMARLWRTAPAEELCRLVSFRDGTWAVMTPDGRFDTNNLENPDGIYWLMPDAPLSPLPLEVFMRDYYEPRLLTRLLDDVPDEEQFRRTRPLGSLNRAQPSVERIEVSRAAPDAVTVKVTVAGTTSPVQKDADGRPLESGVYDLRLFRDGQLVGYTAREEDDARADADEDLPGWRTANRVAPRRGDAGSADCAEAAPRGMVCTFRVRLPRRGDLRRVEFSTYAFNGDRVKSETLRTIYHLDAPPPAAKPRAYFIAVGVDEYDNPAFRSLSYAVNDARAVREVVATGIEREGRYEVVPVMLLSGKGSGAAADGATKENVKAVLDVLAGRLDPQSLTRLPDARRLRRAAPEDLVLLFFAGHGYADGRSRFFLVPRDTSGGVRMSAAEVAPRLLSSEELSQWLRGVDAGELVLVIDACHSAAAAGARFRPGPMGDRGLGQLSYDKGMRILAATQAEGEAMEAAVLADGRRAEHGMLTYALVREGLGLGRADEGARKDGAITVDEWLRYGERRVPALRAGGTAGRTAGPREASTKEERQQPALFDFAHRSADVVLARVGAGARRARRRPR